MNHNLSKSFDGVSPDTKWFVVANRSNAAIFSEGTDHQFHFVSRFENPNGKLTEGQLDSDKPGRCFSAGSSIVRHALDRHFTKHEQVAIVFAIRIGKFLGLSFQNHKFDEITLVAEPHFLGLLREHLPVAVHKAKIHSLDREFDQGSTKEIREMILKAM